MKQILIGAFIFIQLIVYAPHSSAEDIEVVMIETVKDTSAHRVAKELIEKYPAIKPRYYFNLVCNGFSASVPSILIPRLKKEESVSAIFLSGPIKATIKKNSLPKGQPQLQFNQPIQATGKGVKVGVIDTGIDYRHPDLKANYKGGYDLVDQDEDPMETMGSSKKATIHGTHVAGIIAANGKMKGIAPEASIYAYRALGPGGYGTTDQVIASIERAVKDKMDIINLSLGDTMNGPDLPTSKALDKVVKKGIVAVVANGNDGPGIWTVGTPGTSGGAISVGASSDAGKSKRLNFTKPWADIDFQLTAGSPEWDFSHSMIMTYAGLGKRENYENINAKNKIVLVERGVISFKDKVKNAVNAEALGVIIFNNEPGELSASLEMNSKIPVITVSQKDGRKMKKALENGQLTCRTIDIEEKEKLASFSSRGPVIHSIAIKPDVVAPGVRIESTIPGGTYLSLQGTSMAAPYVAGVCALIKEVHPDWSPEKIKSALMTSAISLKNDKDEIYHTFEQGAGRVNVKDALQEDTFLAPSSVTFGMASNGRMYKANIVVENRSSRKKRYYFSIPRKERFMTWKLPLAFVLEGGQKKKLEVQLELDNWKEKSELDDGYLYLNEAGRNKVRKIPYIFAMTKPDYPIAEGVEVVQEKGDRKMEISVYLPFGADSVRFTLYNADSLLYIKDLVEVKGVKRGVLKQKVDLPENILSNYYEIVTEVEKDHQKVVLKNTNYLKFQLE
ncbi:MULTISPECIES: S8 family serine peptidase [unclassified Bacillus (in: firmicutes)]|uniref:S8 family serine peptidase n=1 Tax=unclassified Bacillus (in: firmicutes) TaxID=185979 RepID=UPI001123E0E5|nr:MULTISPECIES: S8 family serine peptidase [unclassified Bacillus (in: firmicutes)]